MPPRGAPLFLRTAKERRRIRRKALIRARRRQTGIAPWYEKRQVDLPIQLQELRRLWWRAHQRKQRGRPVPGMKQLSEVMKVARRDSGDLDTIRRAVRLLTDVLNGE